MEYFKLDSTVLKQQLEVGVYLPPGYDASKQRYPVLYFLHGLFGTSHKWEERSTNATLDGLIANGTVPPMLVVCPDGKNSMYVDAIDGNGDWGEFIATELVETIDGKYRTLEDRGERGINGDSMGGYGALNLAFKHPDVFGSVSAHSAAIYPVDPEKLPPRIKDFAQQWKPVYDWPIDVKHWKEWNPLDLAATLPVETLKKLAIYFDCGDQDRFGFNASNQELHEILQKRGVPHEWYLRSGGHGRDYFSEYAHESMAFHGKQFVAAKQGSAAKPAGTH
jgi:S-formylglutathione hydrolase FrmB